MNSEKLNSNLEVPTIEFTDPFYKPLEELNEEEILTQLYLTNIWVGIIADLLPTMNQQIRDGQYLKQHWERVSRAIRQLEWRASLYRSKNLSTEIEEGAINDFVDLKRDILERLGN